METLSQFDNFRVHLIEELARRCEANARYSLRAFARDLGLEASFLSKVLRRQRAISPRNLLRLGPRVGLGPEEIQKFLNAETEESEPTGRPGIRSRRIPDFRQVEMDHFRVISDWYHFGLLELVHIPQYAEAEAPRLARALGMGLPEVLAAMERLQRLGMLERSKDGLWMDRSGYVTTINFPNTNEALRHLIRQTHENSLKALDGVPLDERDHSQVTMAVRADQMPEAKRLIKNFRRQLMALMESNPGSPDRVYQLSVSLFPVSVPNSKNLPLGEVRSAKTNEIQGKEKWI